MIFLVSHPLVKIPIIVTRKESQFILLLIKKVHTIIRIFKYYQLQ